MTSALEVASLFATLDLRDNLTGALRGAHSQLNNFGGRLDSVGQSLQRVGRYTAIAGGALFAGLGLAAREALTFSSSMTNVQAVLGASAEEMQTIQAQVLALGSTSVAGPQAVAEAFYDIVGGVTDASKHMEVLQAAIATAEAGQANLTGTTSALISVMNSYAASGLSAADASDVLTRTVGVGVGTMDEFASAFPTVAGLASSLDVSFQDLGAAMAFLTTKGFSASESAVQLRAMMTALLNPNERMIKAFEELGVTSGEAALQQYGLVGAFNALQDNSVTFRNEMAGTLGSVQALNGVIALTGEGAAQALDEFGDGLEGATDAAREIQLNDVSAQFSQLKSEITAIAIQIGQVLIPVFRSIIAAVKPVIDSIIEWMRNNQGILPTIVGLAGALGGLLLAANPLGTVIRGIGSAIGLLSSPIGGVIGVIAALTAAYLTNFGGFRDFVDKEVRPKLDEFWESLQKAWEKIRPGLENLARWFTQTALPGIVNFIETKAIPAIETLVEKLQDIWNDVKPHIDNLVQGLREHFENAVLWFFQPFIERVQQMPAETQRAAAGVLNELNRMLSEMLNLANFSGSNFFFQWLLGGSVTPPTPLPNNAPVVPVPGSGFTPIDKGAGKSSTTINVYANDKAGGTAAANAFERSFNNTYNRGR